MSRVKNPVVVVGSINMDLVAHTARVPSGGETVLATGFRMHSGGKGANQAVAVARLGYPVRMIGRIGKDPFGRKLKADLKKGGVDVSGVATTGVATGVAVIVVAESGENTIVITPGANGLLTPQDLDANIYFLRSAGIVLTQLEIPMATVQHLAKICSREGVPLILDPAPAQTLPSGLLQEVSWLTPNETEAAFYTRDAGEGKVDPPLIAERLRAQGAQSVLLKLGSRGAYLASGAIAGERVLPFAVRAIDTTAAGDAFNAAFAVGLLSKRGAIGSAHFAAAAAALSVTRAGAQASMPRLAEVKDLLARNAGRLD